MSTLGSRIRSAREALGMTQVDLANALGKNQVTISNWETDRHIPRMADVEAAARVLGTTAAHLLAGPAQAGHSAPLTIAVVPVVKDLLADEPFGAQNVVGYVPFPPDSDPRGVFAHVLETDDFDDPESAVSFARGDILYLRPHMPVDGSMCVVALRLDRPEGDRFRLDAFCLLKSEIPPNRSVIAPIVGFYRPL